jgi:hypothetical protein
MRRVGILSAVTIAVLAVPVRGGAAVSLVTVSGPSPYASCSTANQPGTVYVNGEVVPQVALNPANPNNVVGVWQQDRWSNGGAQGLVAGFSFDGGATWGETTLQFSACAPNAILDPFTGGPYNRASDPWVSIGSRRHGLRLGPAGDQQHWRGGGRKQRHGCRDGDVE